MFAFDLRSNFFPQKFHFFVIFHENFIFLFSTIFNSWFMLNFGHFFVWFDHDFNPVVESIGTNPICEISQFFWHKISQFLFEMLGKFLIWFHFSFRFDSGVNPFAIRGERRKKKKKKGWKKWTIRKEKGEKREKRKWWEKEEERNIFVSWRRLILTADTKSFMWEKKRGEKKKEREKSNCGGWQSKEKKMVFDHQHHFW